MIGNMVRPARFERATFCSGGKRSIQLSYGRSDKLLDIVYQRAGLPSQHADIGKPFAASPPHVAPSFRRSAAPSGRAGLGVAQKIGRANGRSPSSWLHLFARLRFPCTRTRFWHGKSGLEDASHHSRKTLSQTFHISSPRHFNNLRRRPLLTPYPSPILVRGPETEISGG